VKRRTPQPAIGDVPEALTFALRKHDELWRTLCAVRGPDPFAVKRQRRELLDQLAFVERVILTEERGLKARNGGRFPGTAPAQKPGPPRADMRPRRAPVAPADPF
jgi:hypothetical protein